MFHSSEPTWLFCGTNDGVVSLWDVGTPALPTYDGVNPRQLLKLFPDYGDVYNIAWSGHQSNWLLAGTAAGLVGWNVEAKKVTEQGGDIDNIDIRHVQGELKGGRKQYMHGTCHLQSAKSTQ